MKRLFSYLYYVWVLVFVVVLTLIRIALSFLKLAWDMAGDFSDNLNTDFQSYILSVDYPDEKQ